MTSQVSDQFSSAAAYGDGGASLPDFNHPEIIKVDKAYTPDGRTCLGRLAGTTACYRGYVAHWRLIDRHLYLTRLVGFYKIRDELSPIFADWFSGWIIVGHGEFEPQGFHPSESTRSRCAAFKFQNGELVLERHWLYNSSLDLPAWLQYLDFQTSLDQLGDA